MDSQAQKAIFASRMAGELLVLHLSGVWKLGCGLPGIEEIEKSATAETKCKSVSFDTSKVTGWDSGLMTFLPGQRLSIRSGFAAG